MEVKTTIVFEVVEQSQIGETRRHLITYCQDNGLDEKCCNKIAVACQELCTNLLKHSRTGGKILAQSILDEQSAGLDLYCIDSGIGMDVEECLRDGYSSSGTLGTGLGAIKRMSDEFEIQSVPQSGTVIHMRFWNMAKKAQAKFCWGAISVPKEGERVCGDKWALHIDNDQAYCLIIDGLGHGIEASEAAALAIKRFKSNIDLPPSPMMKLLHTSLRGSRGAVGAVAKINRKNSELSFCGLGNIEGLIWTANDSKRLVSMNGTLGYEARKFNEFSLSWQSNSTLIVHTDGLSSKTLHGIENTEHRPASIVAGWLYKAHAKKIDDATIVVLKGSGAR